MKGYRTKHNAGHAGKTKADDKRVKPSDEIGIFRQESVVFLRR